jgi:hypothetical protein
LSENAREEVQVARDIVSHDGWERFHHSVNAKNSLNKLQIQKEKYITFKTWRRILDAISIVQARTKKKTITTGNTLIQK